MCTIVSACVIFFSVISTGFFKGFFALNNYFCYALHLLISSKCVRLSIKKILMTRHFFYPGLPGRNIPDIIVSITGSPAVCGVCVVSLLVLLAEALLAVCVRALYSAPSTGCPSTETLLPPLEVSREGGRRETATDTFLGEEGGGLSSQTGSSSSWTRWDKEQVVWTLGLYNMPRHKTRPQALHRPC